MLLSESLFEYAEWTFIPQKYLQEHANMWNALAHNHILHAYKSFPVWKEHRYFLALFESEFQKDVEEAEALRINNIEKDLHVEDGNKGFLPDLSFSRIRSYQGYKK